MTTLGDIITAAAQRYGQDPNALTREAQIESSMNPSATNGSAAGLFQFIPSTAAHYGLSNPLDPAASADAAARLMRDNGASLTHSLGRAPTPEELYLAHQQGAGGAASIIQHPDAPVASLVGQAAASGNGGAGLTGGQFAQLWANKFDGVKPSAGVVPVRPATMAEALPVAGLPSTPQPATPDPTALLAALSPQQVAPSSLANQQVADQARRAALFRVTV